ncbi:hypothetical protein D3C75_1179970 [compost metagenome]
MCVSSPPDATAISRVPFRIDLVEQEAAAVAVLSSSGQFIGPHAGQRPPAQIVIELIGHHIRILVIEAGIDIIDHRPVHRAVRAFVCIHYRFPQLGFPPEIRI